MAATANPRARLEHILFHIRGVADTVGGVEFDTYTSVYHMERTVERAVQIISEAVRALPPDLTPRYPEIEWERLLASAMCCGTNTSVLTRRPCGRSRRCGCRRWKK